jgi:hypothetical protein
MQHDEAIQTRAAERYVLGELTAVERDAFEEHFFDCMVCSDDVVTATALADNARGALAAPFPADTKIVEKGSNSGSFSWIRDFFRGPLLVPALSAASLVLATVVAYQNTAVIPGLRTELASRDEVRAVPSITLHSVARGAGEPLSVSSSEPYLLLQADVVPDQPVTRYLMTVLDSSGAEVFRETVRAPEPGTPVSLLVPAHRLRSGSYTLVAATVGANGAAGEPLDRFVFSLDRR